jgi:DNA-directed RNA polymerase subunit beta'
LVDVAQDLTITKVNCDNPGFIELSEILEGGNVVVSLSERSLGRVTAGDIKHPLTGEILIKKNTMINESDCDLIDAAGIKTLKVYSVMTCSSKEGVCATCYGRDLIQR